MHLLAHRHLELGKVNVLKREIARMPGLSLYPVRMKWNDIVRDQLSVNVRLVQQGDEERPQ